MRIIRFIIPAYKNPEQLSKCKQAIANLELPEGTLTETTVINNDDVNRGFTVAVNIGLRQAVFDGNEYAVILNQDCYLFPDALKAMLEYMDTHPEVAIGCPMQLSDQDEDLVICAGGLEAYPNGRHIHGRISEGECLEDKYIHWANGACMVVRIASMINFGLMDESMFLIGSDSDWCYRARLHGHKVAYIAKAKCIHEQGVTSGTADEKVQRIMYLDMVHWRNKWVGTDILRELTMEIFD